MKVNSVALSWGLCGYYYSSSCAALFAASSSSSTTPPAASSSWILPHCAVNGREFQDLAESAGIRRIAFLRHGNTAPATNGVDFDRLLTRVGRNQARQAGRTFGATTLFPFAKVLVSPAPRTVETAQLFLEEVESSVASAGAESKSVSTNELTLIRGLYDGTMQPEGSVLFRKIGYAPLASYVDADDAADREVARRVLGEYSTLVAHEVHQCLRDLTMIESAQRNDAPKATVLIVGHAIYLPAAALGIATLCGSSNQRLLLETNTQEAQGYCIDVELSRVNLLER